VGRLKDGVLLEQAQGEMNTIAERLAKDYPDSNAGTGVVLVSLRAQMIGNYQRPLVVLLVAVGFILLIACANVANLMMARTAARESRDCNSPGNGRRPTASYPSDAYGECAAFRFGRVIDCFWRTWGVQLLLGLTPKRYSRLEGVSVDRWALLFTFVVSIATECCLD